MGKTITMCFTNNKGGSGKSTTCSNLGAAMAKVGKKVLLIDGDMQLNLSLAFFPEDWVLEHAAGELNLYRAIGKQADLTEYVVHTPYENLDLIPSSTLMSSIEYELFYQVAERVYIAEMSAEDQGVRSIRLYSDRCSTYIGRMGHEYPVCFRSGDHSGRSQPVGDVWIGEYV